MEKFPDTPYDPLGALASEHDRLVAENIGLRAQLKAALASRAQEIADLKAENAKLVRENLRLVELIKIANARTFGARSEKVHPHQISLFNDADFASPDAAFEGKDEEAEKPQRPRRKKKRVDWSKFDTTVVEHVMDEGEATCPRCGSALEDMGYEVRHIVHLVPAHIEVEEHRTHKYRCKGCCGENAAGKDADSVIVRAEGPIAPLDKSPAGSSLLAHVLTQKYVNAQPINRIADDLTSNQHLPFTRQTIAGWVIRAAHTYLVPLVDAMADRLRSMDLVHIDETVVQVLKEPGRSPTSKSWMWLFSSAATDVPIFLYRYDPHRSREVPKAFLSGFNGTVVTDGYKVYDDLGEGIRRSACAAHIRRKFLDALKAETPPGADYPTDTPAAVGFAFMEKIYAIERTAKDLAPDGRSGARKERLAPVFDEFDAWAKDAVLRVPEGGLAYKALSYAIAELPHLRLVLEDGRIPIDNNRAERAIRPFAVARKQWLFSDTPHGAAASAAAYSLITTARANGLNPQAYLTWLFDEMPRAMRDGAIDYEDFLPYSATVPDSVRAKEPYCFVDEPLIDIDPDSLDDMEREMESFANKLKDLGDSLEEQRKELDQ